MSREIHCGICNCKVGVIVDASLMKSIAYYCGKCNLGIKSFLEQKALEASLAASKEYLKKVKPNNPIHDLFRDSGLFGNHDNFFKK